MNQISVQKINTSLTAPGAMNGSTALPDTVAALDFERLKFKNTATSEAGMTAQEWDAAELEYRRFLALKVMYPGIALVPSKLVDKIWHAHILDTRAYRDNCEKVFGRFIDHYPYFGIYGDDDHEALQQSSAQTVELYERHFGAYPKDSDAVASRCAGHACHVPTTCACRSPGACK